ncbi:MAG: hypothetical protein ABIE94_06530 [archaeon]
MNLIEWTVDYVKHKDLFKKTLVTFEVNKDLIEFEFLDKKHYYLISETLDVSLLAKVKKYTWKTLVCLNNDTNMLVLLNNWKKFAAMSQLYLIFVSEKGGKWVICPESHNRISDPESLKEGLTSMADAAEGKYTEMER